MKWNVIFVDKLFDFFFYVVNLGNKKKNCLDLRCNDYKKKFWNIFVFIDLNKIVYINLVVIKWYFIILLYVNWKVIRGISRK